MHNTSHYLFYNHPLLSLKGLLKGQKLDIFKIVK